MRMCCDAWRAFHNVTPATNSDAERRDDMRAPVGLARGAEDRPREHEQREPEHGADREHHVRAVDAADRCGERYGAEGGDSRRTGECQRGAANAARARRRPGRRCAARRLRRPDRADSRAPAEAIGGRSASSAPSATLHPPTHATRYAPPNVRRSGAWSRETMTVAASPSLTVPPEADRPEPISRRVVSGDELPAWFSIGLSVALVWCARRRHHGDGAPVGQALLRVDVHDRRDRGRARIVGAASASTRTHGARPGGRGSRHCARAPRYVRRVPLPAPALRP